MIFNDCVCFEINICGERARVQKLIDYLNSGELDEFFEVDEEFFLFDDSYDTAAPDEEVRVMFSSDEFGIEVESFDSDEFLEVLCKAGKQLHLSGNFYNFDDDEFRFISEAGNDYYINENNVSIFRDELDMQASKEEEEAGEDKDEEY